MAFWGPPEVGSSPVCLDVVHVHLAPDLTQLPILLLHQVAHLDALRPRKAQVNVSTVQDGKDAKDNAFFTIHRMDENKSIAW